MCGVYVCGWVYVRGVCVFVVCAYSVYFNYVYSPYLVSGSCLAIIVTSKNNSIVLFIAVTRCQCGLFVTSNRSNLTMKQLEIHGAVHLLPWQCLKPKL